MILNKENLIEYFINFNTELMLKMTEVEHGYLNMNPNSYHLEGNIWIHTKMVLEQIEKEYKTDIKYKELLIAALLHDIGKVYTFEDNPKTKKRYFTGHEGVSTFYSKKIIENIQKYFNIKINKNLILKIISLHGSFYQYIDENGIKPKSIKKIEEKYKKHPDLLKNLAKFIYADSVGRTIEVNKLEQKEKSKTNRTQLINIANNINYQNKNKQNNKELIILIGPPRIGKSTYINNFLKNNPEYVVISRDELVEKKGVGKNYNEKFNSLNNTIHKEIDLELLKLYNNLLNQQKNIIIDMTNMSEKSRKKWVKNQKIQKNYKKTAIVFIDEPEIMIERGKEKNKTISQEIIHNMMKRFIMPTDEEIDNIKINNMPNFKENKKEEKCVKSMKTIQ